MGSNNSRCIMCGIDIACCSLNNLAVEVFMKKILNKGFCEDCKDDIRREIIYGEDYDKKL